MATLERKNGCIAYEAHGESRPGEHPLVILRGLGRSVKHWLGYEQVLAKSFKVITMDLRGIGDSTVASGWGTSLFDIADDVCDVLDDLKIDKAHVLGVSLGGMVTLAAGLARPERCASLVVVNTSIAGMATLRISPSAIRAVVAAGLSKDQAATQAGLVDVLIGAHCTPERRTEIASRYAELAQKQGLYPVTVMKQLIGAARFRVKGRLKDMHVPTLVVYGTNDRFVPNVNSQKIAKLLPNAKIVAIQGGGHEVTLDHGDELAALVAEWAHEADRRKTAG